MRFGEHAGHTQLANLLPQFANAPDAGRTLLTDDSGTHGCQSKAVLEIPVGVVENDKRFAANRGHLSGDLLGEIVEPVLQLMRILLVNGGISWVGLGQGFGHHTGHGPCVDRIQPHVQVERTAIVFMMAVILAVLVFMMIVIFAVRVPVVTGFVVTMIMVVLERSPLSQGPANQTLRMGQFDNPGIAGQGPDGPDESRLHPFVNQENNRRFFKHCSV